MRIEGKNYQVVDALPMRGMAVPRDDQEQHALGCTDPSRCSLGDRRWRQQQHHGTSQAVACGIEDRLLSWLCVRALPRGSRVLGCGQEVLVARSCLEVELRRRNGGVPRIPRRVRSCLHGGPDHPAHGARLAPPLWRDQILPATTHDSTATNHHDDKSVLGLAHDHNDSSV